MSNTTYILEGKYYEGWREVSPTGMEYDTRAECEARAKREYDAGTQIPFRVVKKEESQ